MSATPTPAAATGRKVLFVSGLQVDPPRSGGNLRSAALVTALRRRGFDVFVYSLGGRKADYLARRPSSIQRWSDGTPEYVGRGAAGFVAQYSSYALGLPPLWLTSFLRAGVASPGGLGLPRLLRDRLRWCDAILADAPFVHPVFAAAKGRLRVLNTHNVEHRLYDRPGRLWARVRAAVRALEVRAAQACDVVVSCCADDAAFFEAAAQPRRSIVVPNGVDLQRWHGLDALRAAMRQSLGIAERDRVFLFTASKWGPNHEAFASLLAFARQRGRWLAEHGIHILVVGSVTAEPLGVPGLTATGSVARVEPYFAAADAALNPVRSGGGTNVKTGEFLALRLPLVTTRFGSRGFDVEDGESAFVFEEAGLADALLRARRLFDEDPARLARMTERAWTRNRRLIDMDLCVEPLVAALSAPGEPARDVQAEPVLGVSPA